MIVPDPADWLSGYIADLPTPFRASGAVDLQAFRRLCERQIEAGASAIVVCETAGEASTLTPDEHGCIVGTAVATAGGRIKVIAGAGSNSTSQAIEWTRRAEAACADAVLSVVPYYNKPMQAGIEAHFRTIADATTLPIILHDIPARTNRELADDTLIRLARSDRFIGLRDGGGDVTRPARLKPLLRNGFRLLTGDDTTALAYFTNGGDGCISAISNVAPDLCRTLFCCCEQQRWSSARGVLNRLAPLTALLASDDPAALKTALSMLGLMRATMRLPLVEPDVSISHAIADAVGPIKGRDAA